MSYTHEGAIQKEHTQNHAIEFFSKAGSLMRGRNSFYEDESSALDLFKQVWYVGDYKLAMKLLFWVRDIRGGAGNRSGFEEIVNWLASQDYASKWVKSNLHLIPTYGRYKDLKSLFNTSLETYASDFWSDKILEGDGLAAKWAKRTDKPLLKSLRKKKAVKDISEFRKLLTKNRTNIVENKMCKNEWKEIDFSKVPSVALSRYTRTFNIHTPETFQAFKEKVESGEVKINTGALFPHDCVRTVMNGDKDIANSQFDNLPNFLNTDQRILSVVDTSGSMGVSVSGSIKAWHVSTALGLYCSDRLGKDNPFYRKFLQFCDEGKLTDWNDHKFSDCYENLYGWGYENRIFNGAVGTTRIDVALNTILEYGKFLNATKEQMPNVLLIISDMQFTWGMETLNTPVETIMEKWEQLGYDRPKIVYWNTAGYAGSPDEAFNNNVGLVSGFSPSILKAIFEGEDFSPIAIMHRTLEKYEITEPKE